MVEQFEELVPEVVDAGGADQKSRRRGRRLGGSGRGRGAQAGRRRVAGGNAGTAGAAAARRRVPGPDRGRNRELAALRANIGRRLGGLEPEARRGRRGGTRRSRRGGARRGRR